MGQAKQRKKLLSTLGPRTRGTGFRYVDSPPIEEPTQEQLVARAIRQQEEQIINQERQQRREIVTVICAGARNMLSKWRQQIDQNALRLRNFAGWTNDNMCSLPVDSDAAQVYCMQFSRHRLREGKLTIEMMDEIVRKIFREDNTDEIVANILNIIKTAAEESITGLTFDKTVFLDKLQKRQKREKSNHDWVYYGLGFVHEMMNKSSHVRDSVHSGHYIR